MRVLVLTTSTSVSEYAVATAALQSRGIVFDTAALAPSGAFLLQNMPPLGALPNGDSPYYGVLITHQALIYRDTAGAWRSALNPVDAALRDYERSNGVRRVVLGAAPGADTYTSAATLPSTGAPVLRWSLPDAWRALGAGLNLSTALPMPDLTRRGARIDDARSVALAYFDAGTAVAAVLCTPEPRRQVLALFFDHATWSVASLVVHNVWLQFLTRGVYLGARRLYISPHVDDVLLASDLWQPALRRMINGGPTARFTPEDYTRLIAWQQRMNLQVLPAGSNLTLELWLNGAGAFGDPTMNQYGVPVQVAPPDDAGALQRAFAAQPAPFLWGSHTWSHPSLNAPCSYESTRAQLALNEAFAHTWLGTHARSDVRWQRDSLVTPMITGLLNADALRGMYAHGVRSASGDISRAELTHPNAYYARYASTDADARVLIVPRAPCNIYFNCYNTTCTESQYDTQYESYWGGASTYAQIVRRDADDVLRRTLVYRADALMFHQANLVGVQALGGASLLEDWLERVLLVLRQYLTLPVRSVGQSALAREYAAREVRDACGDFGASVTLHASDDRWASVSIPPRADTCTVAARLSLPRTAYYTPSTMVLDTDEYGPDQTLTLAPGTLAL